MTLVLYVEEILDLKEEIKQITKEIKTIAKKYILAGIREASPNRNSINGNSKFPTLPNIAIRTNAAETYFD